MEKLTDAVADYLEMQIEAGADAVQIFDSMGGMPATGTLPVRLGEMDRRNRFPLGQQGPRDRFFKGNAWLARALG